MGRQRLSTLGSRLINFYGQKIPVATRANGGEEDLGASVVTGSNPTLDLEPAEHDLDPLGPFVATAVEADLPLSAFPVWDADPHP